MVGAAYGCALSPGAIDFASDAQPDQSLLSWAATTGYPALWHLKEQYRRIRLYRNWSFGPSAEFRRSQSAHDRADFLDDQGTNLALVLSHFQGQNKRQLVTALQNLYHGIVDITCPVTGGTVGLYLEETDNRTIPATRLSDGTLRYLCLLAVLLHPDPPPLVVIEEPELGLHPDLLPKLTDLLRARLRAHAAHRDNSLRCIGRCANRGAGKRRRVRKTRRTDSSPTARQRRPGTLVGRLSPRRALDVRRAWRKPMVTAKLYIEGGGDSREQSIRFREAWNGFFASAGVGTRTQIVRGGGRKQTFDRFVTATKRRAPSVIPLLLVDSEEAVASHSVWQTSPFTRSLEQACWRPRRSGVSDGPGYGNLVSGRCRCAERVFRSAAQAERAQAMASVGRRPQSDCDGGASKSDCGMRQALCQRPDLVRVARDS